MLPKATKLKKLELALRNGSAKERQEAIQDPDITSDLVLLGLNDKFWKVQELAAASPKLSKKHILGIISGSIRCNASLQKLYSRNPNFDAECEMAAMKSDKWWLKVNIARESEIPNVILKAVRDQNIDVRVAAASNPKIGAKAAQVAVNNKSAKVRAAIASSARLSEEDIAKLSVDKYPTVRAKVALNPNVPVLIATRLAKDSDVAVANLGKIALRKLLSKSINVKE